MAYALNFSSGGTVVFSPTTLNGTWVWEIEVEVPDSNNQRVLNFNNNNFRYLRANSGFWELRNNLAGLPNVVSTTPVTPNTRTVIRVEAIAGDVYWSIDGNDEGLIGPQTNDFILNNLNNTSNFTGKVYTFTVDVNGAPSHEWIKNTLSGDPDTVYDDNVGSNPGSLTGFPSNNLHWEFFDNGGGGTLGISPSSISSEEVFGTHNIAVGGVELQVGSIASQEAFGSTSLSSQGVVISPEQIVSEESVGTPEVAVTLSILSPEAIDSDEFVPNPVLENLLKKIFVPDISPTFAVGKPDVVGGDRIVIPIIARTNFTKVLEYLNTLGFTGALEDAILAWLRSEGYEGQWNEAWYGYLEDLGHTGALPERLYRWKRGIT